MNASKTNPMVGRARLAASTSLLAGGLLLTAGCVTEPESHVVSAPPPPAPQTQVVVTPAPSPQVAQVVQQPSGAVIVTQAPPAVQPEIVSAQPSVDHKWVPGYWTWRNSRYEWISGHWEMPPHADAVWVAPRWERTSSGAYRFYEGYWD